MQALSPKQYFQQRLRSLPLDACKINENWQEAGLANVLITRRHINGNMSGAFFLVDLKCLGVKDVHWFFNEFPESLEDDMDDMPYDFVDVDYTLAHNIVYAGHDFAAEYHIQPHPEFAIARFALEEDDDGVEMVEVPTGENDIPHLIERHPGQYADALSKLKKYAGEGQYKHTVMFGSSEEADEEEEAWKEDEDDDEYDDEGDFYDAPEIRLHNIPVGELDLKEAKFIADEDLKDFEQMEKRNKFEQWLLLVENVARNYEPGPENEEEAEIFYDTAYELLANALDFPNNIPMREMESGLKATMEVLKANKEDFDNETAVLGSIRSQLEIHGDNPIFIHKMIAIFSNTFPSVQSLLERYGANLAQYPLVKLSQVFAQYWRNRADDSILPKDIAESTHPQEAFPDYEAFSDQELALFWAIKALQCAGNRDLERMIWYFIMFGETDYSEDTQEITSGLILGLVPRMSEELEEIARKYNS